MIGFPAPAPKRPLDSGTAPSGLPNRGERPRAERELLAKRGSIRQTQTPAELVPIPDASRILPDASRIRPGYFGMRRDFEFRQISANSGKIAANSEQILGKI